jgi:hypothetical protein
MCHSTAILWVSLVSFAAITPCTASQRVLLLSVLNVIYDFLTSDLKEKCNCVRFCLKLLKTASEMHKLLREHLVTMP